MGLCMNASKAEARLDMATLLLGLLFVRGRIAAHLLQPGDGNLDLCYKYNRLYMAFVPAKVLYLVEQLPYWAVEICLCVG